MDLPKNGGLYNARYSSGLGFKKIPKTQKMNCEELMQRWKRNVLKFCVIYLRKPM